MSEIPECPYCASSVPVGGRRLSYDEKVKIRCPNCGGQFEYIEGWGTFSLPGEGPRTQSRMTYEGSYPGEIYEGSSPWEPESPTQQQSTCGTCCTVLCCIISISFIFPLFMIFGGFWWLFG